MNNHTSEKINEARETLKTIRRYATVANGTALVLSMNAISRPALGEMLVPSGRFSLWCFFIGLIFSFVHLLYHSFFLLSSAYNETVSNLAETERVELKKSNEQISFEFVEIPNLRNLQEYTLWVSLALFAIGVISILTQI